VPGSILESRRGGHIARYRSVRGSPNADRPMTASVLSEMDSWAWHAYFETPGIHRFPTGSGAALSAQQLGTRRHRAGRHLAPVSGQRLQRDARKATAVLIIPNFTRDRAETILSLEAVRLFEDDLEGKDKILWQL
jgi:hypothetical protein